MTKIELCIQKYEELLKKDYFLTLENGIELHIFFRKENFSHLAGLHKLTDLNISKMNGSAIYKRLKQGRITQRSDSS